MPTRKTGTVTGANLEPKSKGKKGGLTGSKRVTGETTTTPPSNDTVTDTEIQNKYPTAIPTPASVGEKFRDMVNGANSAINAFQGYTSCVGQSIQGTDSDHNPSAITNGQVNTVEILKHASVDIDENIPQMDSAEATKLNIIKARQRNYVGVAINDVKLKQDLATLDNEQKRLIGMLIDGKTLDVNNETKAVGFHRAVTARDTELSRLEQDRELLTQQHIRTEGTQNQTELIREQEQLKIQKLREEIERQGYEIQSITYEKERLKQETEAKFLAGF